MIKYFHISGSNFNGQCFKIALNFKGPSPAKQSLAFCDMKAQKLLGPQKAERILICYTGLERKKEKKE